MNITREERIKRKMIKKGLLEVEDAKVISTHSHQDIKDEQEVIAQQNAELEKVKAQKLQSEKVKQKNMETENKSAPSENGQAKAASSPFNKAVVERDYTKQPVEVTGDIPDSIPEPTFQKRVIDMDATGSQEGADDMDDDAGDGSDNAADNTADDTAGGDSGGSDAGDAGDDNGGHDGGDYKQPQFDPLKNVRNPAMDELEDKEAKKAANDLVETIFNGLDWASELLRESCLVSKPKLQRKSLKGEFDMTLLDVPLTEEEGGGTFWDAFESLNDTAATAFVIKDEWKENVRKPLRNILIKKGLGVTDEQQLLFYGVQIGIQWATAFATIQISHKQIFKILRRISKERDTERNPYTKTDPDVGRGASQQATQQQPSQSNGHAEQKEAEVKPPKSDAEHIPTAEVINETVSN